MQYVIPGFTPKYFLKNISRNWGPELPDWYLVTWPQEARYCIYADSRLLSEYVPTFRFVVVKSSSLSENGFDWWGQ